MPKGTPSLLYSAPCEAGFDAEKFLSLARSVFSNVSAGDGRIRSGRHIPRGFKNLVSSYKIIASHTPLMGGGRIDVAVVKLCPGAELTAAVQNGNVYGTQFHPEKSGETGLKILKAFCRLEGKA